MFANVLNKIRSKNVQETFQKTVALSMDMKRDCRGGYIWSILVKLW